MIQILPLLSLVSSVAAGNSGALPPQVLGTPQSATSPTNQTPAVPPGTTNPKPQSERTPPIQPNVTAVPLPPAVQLPVPPIPLTSDVVQPLTAGDAARIALKLQPSLLAAQAQILAAQGRTQEARAGLLPSINVGTGYSYVGTITSGSTSTSSSTGTTGTSTKSGSGSGTGFTSSATLSQLIFDFNHTLDNVRQATALERAARESYTRAQSDLVLAVKTAYYTFVQNQELVTVQEANLASRQASLALAQARLNAGIGEPVDLVTAQTNVADASQALASARATALSSRISLALQMGVDARTPIVAKTSDEPQPPSNDVNALVDLAMNNRPELRQYRQTIKAANYEVSAAKTSSAPSVGLAIGIGSRGPNDPFATSNASIGLTLNWAIVDGGRASGLVKQARADVLTAQSNYASSSQQVVQDVSQAYVALRTAEQRATILQSEVANGQEAVRLAKGRFRAGLGLFIDVETAQATLVSAQTLAVNALASIQQARASLRHALGQI